MIYKKAGAEKAREILDNCVENKDGCLIWQGNVNKKGYGTTQFRGQLTLVHRIVALYGVDRTEEQLAVLDRCHIKWACGHTICLKHNGKHMHFSMEKPEKDYEDPSSVDKIVEAAVAMYGY